ncbi:MAG TPA: YihY/virulence factor BrkB family protein [Streptosporangiaceae bacterium]
MNPAEKTVRVVDRFQQRQPWLAFPVAVWKKFGDDQAGNLAALIAYYAFVSIFPLLLVAVTVLAIVLRDHLALQTKIIDSALANYPGFGATLKDSVHKLSGTGPALGFGIVLTLLGARGVANAMQNALNSVWEVPKAARPGFPWSWLRSFGLIFLVGGGAIATSVLSGVIGGAGHVLPGLAVKIFATIVSLAANIGLFWLGFRLATAKVVSWKDLLLGAVIAGCAWQILQFFGSYFISHQLARSNSLYGTFGTVLVLIAWLYLQAEATLYAAEANVVLVHRLWPRSLAPPPHTPEDVRALRLYAEVEERDKEIPVSVAPRVDPAGPGDHGAPGDGDGDRDGDEPGDQNGHSAEHPAVSGSEEGAQAEKSAVPAGETQGEESHDR